MKQSLNKKQLDYILYHLSHHINGWDNIKDFITYETDSVNKNASIIFKSSNKAIDLKNILYYKHIPVLFPVSNTSPIWEITQNEELIFKQDILKSAFYLLSGYQEWESSQFLDEHERFNYSYSIQCKLQIITKPIVNYYFDIIIEALIVFANQKGILISKKSPFSELTVLMTHDVDRVDFFKCKSVLYRWLQLFVPSKRQLSFFKQLKLALISFLNIFKSINSNTNPYWSFSKIRKVEDENNIKSTWFFLNNELGAANADYKYTDKVIRELVTQLQSEECETGIHGSFSTAHSIELMSSVVNDFKLNFNQVPVGNRQHFLKGKLPQLFIIQQKAGLAYDSTMGFAHHEGFRHSYCHPYKPFNHDTEEIIDIWELPLVYMDTTVFEKRNLNFDDALQSANNLMDEVAKFNGIFTLLWHNCRNNEWLQPGISDFYNSLCKLISSKKASCLTCSQALNNFQNQIK